MCINDKHIKVNFLEYGNSRHITMSESTVLRLPTHSVPALNPTILRYLSSCFANIQFGDLSTASIQNMIQNVIASQEVFVQHRNGLIDLLKSSYIREVWISESPPDNNMDTINIADLLVEGGTKPDDMDEHTWNKLDNIHRALNIHVLDNSTNEDEFFHSANFNVNFVRKVHSTIGNGVILNAGEFRKHNVCARYSSVQYARHSAIEEHLNALLSFVRESIKTAPHDIVERVAHMIKLGSIFFSEFLLIHPFSNGNGRTARIMLNAMLKHAVVVPFSLYVKNREEYLRVLEKRNDRSAPSALAEYILLAINQTASNVNWIAMSM